MRPGRQSGLLSFQQTQLSEKDERFDYLLISSSALDTFVQIHFKTTKVVEQRRRTSIGFLKIRFRPFDSGKLHVICRSSQMPELQISFGKQAQ